MWKSTYGDPTLTVRLPRWQHAALKRVARSRGTTVSAMLRGEITALLRDAGETGYKIEPLPGQLRFKP